MFCKNCGNQIREGAAFCPKCGTAVNTNTEPAEQEYTPLVPKYDNIDTSKPIYERIKDIDKPLCEDNFEEPKSAPKKKSKKKLIISLCVIFTVLVGIGVFVLFEINQPPLTLETAYDKYINILEKDEKQIKKFSKSNESDNIVVIEDGETDIPCVLYLTYDNNNEPVLHSLFTKEKSVAIDTKVLFASYAVVQREKMTFFKVDSDEHIYFWLGENLWQSDRIDGDYKYLAQRYSSNENVSEFVILENGEKKEVSEKEYNEFISKYLDNATTIIISAISNNQLKHVFPNVTKNLSMNYEDAIEFLKEKKIPAPFVSDIKFNEKTTSSKKESVNPTTSETSSETKTIKETSFSITQSEIESEIEKIRTYYYSPSTDDDKLVIEKGQGDWGYSRDYRYHNDKLVFAFVFDGTEEHRLYFLDDNMIRYIDEDHITYDYPNTDKFRSWEEKVLSEAYSVKKSNDNSSNSDSVSDSVWIGTWTASTGESLEITSVSSNGVSLVFNKLSEQGNMMNVDYEMEFDNSEKTIASEIGSKEDHGGWKYTFVLKDGYIIVKSRYPDQIFYKK